MGSNKMRGAKHVDDSAQQLWEVLKSVFWVTVITCFFSAAFVYAYVRLPQWSPTYGNFIFVAALLLFVSLFATSLFRSPPVATRSAVVERMRELATTHATCSSSLSNRPRSCDIGSGDGRIPKHFSHVFDAHGIELNGLLVIWSTISACCSQNRATFRWANLWHVNLAQYDVLTTYQSTAYMEGIGAKILQELPDHAIVIAHQFSIREWQEIDYDEEYHLWTYKMSHVRRHLAIKNTG